MLKSNLKDTRAEKRCLHEKYTQLKTAYSTLEMEKENLLKDSQSLVNLRTEHSKLKVGYVINSDLTSSSKMRLRMGARRDH